MEEGVDLQVTYPGPKHSKPEVEMLSRKEGSNALSHSSYSVLSSSAGRTVACIPGEGG